MIDKKVGINVYNLKLSCKHIEKLLFSLICLIVCLLVFLPSLTLQSSANVVKPELNNSISTNSIALSPCSNISFDSPISSNAFPVGGRPQSVVIKDLDGDGKLDLAAVNNQDDTVSVLKNISTSTSTAFAPKIDFPVGHYPFSLTTVDVDGDGKEDLVVASGLLSVLKNTSTIGSISFAPKIDFSYTQNAPLSIAVGDIDGDGKLDLAISSLGTYYPSIWRNTSTIGSISFEHIFLEVPYTSSIALGDIDGDGKLDIVTTDYESSLVSVLKNTSTIGSISFDTPVDFAVGVNPFSLAIGDIDRDGKIDVAARSDSGTVSILRNTSTIGSISFAPKVDFSSSLVSGNHVGYLALGDLDGDSDLDLVVTNKDINIVSVLKNISSPGAITFAPNVDFTVNSPMSVAIGNLTSNSLPDLGVINYSTKTISVLKNFSTPSAITFDTNIGFFTGNSPSSVAIGDLDGDGKADLAVGNLSTTNSISVLRNTSSPGSIGANSFAPKLDFSTGSYPISVVIGDINGDGKLDLAVANFAVGTVSVLRNTSSPGSISFATKIDFTVGTNPYSVAIGDINGDGKLDLVTTNVANNTVSVLRNTSTSGSVSFASQDVFFIGAHPISVAIGDLNGDGKPDLAVANYLSNTVSVLLNSGNIGSISSFAARSDFAVGSQPNSVAIEDLDRDGKADLAVTNYIDSTVSILKNTTSAGAATSSFASKVDFSSGFAPTSVAIGDLDGNGKLDLSISNSVNGVSVLRNVGSTGSIDVSTFAPKADFFSGGSPMAVAIEDLDRDGKLDLAVANYTSNSVSVLRNICQTCSTIQISPSSLPAATVGVSYNVTLIASGGTSPYGFSSTGALPSGISFSTAGVLSGTTTQIGSFPITVTVTDVNGCPSSKDLTLVVNPGAATSFMVTTSTSSTLSGQSFDITVRALDIVGNTATGYRGTIAFTSSDTAATFASNYTFTSGDAGIKAFTNGGTLRTPGTQSITAIDTVNSSITGSANVTVSKANTTTMLSSGGNPSVYGQSVTFTALVGVNSPGSGTPSGNVSFFDGATQIGSAQSLSSGSATLSVSNLPVGTRFITAVYSGDTKFNASTSSAVNQTVNKANTSSALSASQSQVAFGQTVILTDIVSAVAPGSGIVDGSVTFMEGSTLLGNATINNSGNAILSVVLMMPGTRTITATYSGSSSFNASTSNSINITVTTIDHNTLYVADTLNNRIQRSTNNGLAWQAVGNGAGTAAGQFNAPKGVAANFTDTVIFVADTLNNRLQRSIDGGKTWTIIATAGRATNQVNQPSGLAYDESSDKLYIADTMNNRILVISNASTANPIFAVFAGATAGTTVGKFNQPQSVAVSLSGIVYVADTMNHRVQVNNNGLETGWTVLAGGGTAAGQMNTPKGVYVDNSGKVWIADTMNNRIQVNVNGVWSVFMASGTAVGAVNRPEAMVVNLLGSVFIADTANNRIQCKLSGGTVSVVGGPGTAIGSFNQPSTIR